MLWCLIVLDTSGLLLSKRERLLAQGSFFGTYTYVFDDNKHIELVLYSNHPNPGFIKSS